MIKENIKDLITSIAEGNSVAIQDNFNAIMSAKIADQLDIMRASVASDMFRSSVVKEEVDVGQADSSLRKSGSKSANYKVVDKSGKTISTHDNQSSAIRQALKNDDHRVVKEEVELDEALEKETIKHPVGQRPKGVGWTLKQAGEQTGKDHSVWERKVKKVASPSFNKEELSLEDYSIEELEDFMMSEDFEQLDELSKQTLGSYVKKASDSVMSHSGEAGYKLGAQEKGEGHDDYKKAWNRNKNIHKAVSKLTK